jgi:Virulence protein
METVKNNSEIVLYQPDSSINLEVVLENESLWLTLDNLSTLYQRDKSTISRHIKNIFKEGELKPYAVVANFATTASDGKTYQVDYYNLDVIISVGYRVKSQKGVEFRKWANVIIKNHIIKANALNVRVDKVEEEVFYLKKKTEELDTIVKGQLPPHEGVFYDGQIFDAYVFASDLIRRAKHEIILIDNYIDESVLIILNKRNDGVKATIYTANLSKDLKLDLDKHNSQYQPIDIKVFKNSHDRFLIIDDEVYHIGASLKDLGKKMFAFSKLNFEKEKILEIL